MNTVTNDSQTTINNINEKQTRSNTMENQTVQNKAIQLGNECVLHSANMVLTAAKCGKALVTVQKIYKKDGEYTAWVKENMPVGERQCQKFVKLYTAKPVYATDPNPDSLSFFDIDSEIKMVKVDDNIEKQIREENKKKKMTRKQVSERIKELKGKKNGKRNKGNGNPSNPLSDVRSHTIALKKEITNTIGPIEDEAGLKKWNNTIKDMETAIRKIKIETDKFEKTQAENKETAKTS